MPHPVPIIYVRSSDAPRVSLWGRLGAMALAGACLGVLITATRVRPDASGVGTHISLGFAPCGFESRSGLPCPTCGMTTSFAWFVRGDFIGSLYIHPGGLLLAAVGSLSFWGGLYIALTGRPVHRLLRQIKPRYYLWPMLAVLVLGWAWKMWIHVQGLDGWR